MFERFTDRARTVIVHAQEQASLLRHNYVGTEHLLLGVLVEAEGVGARVLADQGVDLDGVREAVVALIGEGAVAPSGHIPFTPRAKKVMELSLRQAISLGHTYIGTEHMVLALLEEGEGVAAQILVGMGLDLEAARAAVIELLGAVPAEAASDMLFGELWPTPGVFEPLRGFAPGWWVATIRQLMSWQVALMALVFFGVSLVALWSPRPPSGWIRSGLILFIGGVVAASVGAAIQQVHAGYARGRGARPARWFNLAALLLFATGAVLITFDVVLS